MKETIARGKNVISLKKIKQEKIKDLMELAKKNDVYFNLFYDDKRKKQIIHTAGY